MLMVAVLQQKGGAGKTTLAVHLASLVHLLGLRTLLIDIDKQASSFEWSVAREEGSPLEGLSVIKLDQPKALDLSRLVPVVRGYDVIILDGPPRFDDITQRAAVAADIAVVPVVPGGPDFWATVDTHALLDAADSTRDQLGRPPIPRAIVLNRYASGTLLAREADLAIRKKQGAGFFAGVVHQRTAFGYTMVRGETALTSAGNAGARDDIERLWRALNKGMKNAQQPKKAKPGTPEATA